MRAAAGADSRYFATSFGWPGESKNATTILNDHIPALVELLVAHPSCRLCAVNAASRSAFEAYLIVVVMFVMPLVS
jgi:hypothetical protein